MKIDVKEAHSRPQFETGDDSSRETGDQEERMRKMEEAGKPGPGHAVLNLLVGDWKAEVKCWMEPDDPPHISQGTAKASWKFNGRFLEEDFRGDMMGKPFTGRTFMGYDTTKQTYNSVWVSDTQTSMFVSDSSSSCAPTSQ